MKKVYLLSIDKKSLVMNKSNSEISKQLQITRNYARSNGYEIVKEANLIFSSQIDRQKKLTKLFRNLNKEGVDTVIVERLYRIARNVSFYSSLMTLLSKKGIELISAEEGSMNRSLLGNVIASIAQYEEERK